MTTTTITSTMLTDNMTVNVPPKEHFQASMTIGETGSKIKRAFSKVKETISRTWSKAVSRFKKANTFVKYATFFGTAIVGSLVSFTTLSWALYYALYIPISFLGFPMIGYLLYLISFYSTWLASSFVWFEFVDKVFTF